MVTARNDDPFPVVPNAKGLQVQLDDDAVELGVHHAGINVNLTGLYDPASKPGANEFRFAEGYLNALDRQIKSLSDRGVIVYVILIAYPSKNPAIDEVVLHPNFRKDYKFSVASPNPNNGYLEAVISMLAERWSGAHPEYARVWGWIIGNEVNSHWMWHNMGPADTATLVSEYEKVYRISHEAIRKHSKNARTYVSMDHHWTGRIGTMSPKESTSGKAVLDGFARLVRERGEFDWNLAWHPYPEDLFKPQTWNDKTATDDFKTKRITFKNLEVLTKYLDQPSMHFEGKPRHLILSEQGFHTPSGPDGEKIQAAAYAYAWEKVQSLPAVDAFIYHRHVDHAQEGGLHLGLWTNQKGSIATPDRKKAIYDLFQKAGTPEWRSAADALLPVTGLESWQD